MSKKKEEELYRKVVVQPNKSSGKLLSRMKEAKAQARKTERKRSISVNWFILLGIIVFCAPVVVFGVIPNMQLNDEQIHAELLATIEYQEFSITPPENLITTIGEFEDFKDIVEKENLTVLKNGYSLYAKAEETYYKFRLPIDSSDYIWIIWIVAIMPAGIAGLFVGLVFGFWMDGKFGLEVRG